MIKPINDHVIIEPVEKDSFVQTVEKKYEEIGIVLDFDPAIGIGIPPSLQVGSKVYFDSWMAAKYPKKGTTGYYWLVPYESIRAYEPLPKE